MRKFLILIEIRFICKIVRAEHVSCISHVTHHAIWLILSRLLGISNLFLSFCRLWQLLILWQRVIAIIVWIVSIRHISIGFVSDCLEIFILLLSPVIMGHNFAVVNKWGNWFKVLISWERSWTVVISSCLWDVRWVSEKRHVGNRCEGISQHTNCSIILRIW